MINQLTLSSDSQHLKLEMTNGSLVKVSAAYLRRHARDAISTRERIENGVVAVSSTITIKDVKPLGGRAINIVFSDGHDRAVYPLNYLKELAHNYCEELQ